MKAIEFALILSGVLLNAAAQLFLKAGATAVGRFDYSMANAIPIGWKLATQPPIVAGLFCYAISVVVWILALSRVPVSVAYPMLSIGYVVNALAAWWLFGEALTAAKFGGIGFIIVGVVLVSRG